MFDNYDDPRTFSNVQEYIPQGEHGCVLFTSRHTDSNELADHDNVVELPGLSPENSLELLHKKCHTQNVEGAEIEGARIVERLGYHALAITQAGAYIQRQKLQLCDFLLHYNDQRAAILQQTFAMSQYRRKLNEQDKETALTVFTTWELSFQHLRDQEADLLTLFAFFNNKDISEQLFEKFLTYPDNKTKTPKYLDPAMKPLLDSNGNWDKYKFAENIINFFDIALLQSWNRESDGYLHFSLHPLVQYWILLRTTKDVFQKFFLLSSTSKTMTLRYLPVPFCHGSKIVGKCFLLIIPMYFIPCQ